MRKFGLSLVLAVTMALTMATAAFAVHTNETPGDTGTYTSDEFGAAGNQTTAKNTQKYAVKVDGTGVNGAASLDCTACHENNAKHTAGPHGGYTTTTNKCMTCHGLHARSSAQGNKAWSDRLLPGTYTVEVCAFCHDLTESDLSPYTSSYMAAQSQQVKSAHRIAGLGDYLTDAGAGASTYTNAYTGATYTAAKMAEGGDLVANRTIPGGDYVTGGNAELNVGAQGKLSGAGFTCDSCHTPHAVNGATVDPYVGESHVKWGNITGASQTFYATQDTGSATVTVAKANAIRVYLTDRLLKAQLNTTGKFDTAVGRVYTRYNSNWCAGCHQGRFASEPAEGSATVHNHPVSVDPMDANGKATSHNEDADAYKFTQWATFTGNLANDGVTAIDSEAKMVAAARTQEPIWNAGLGKAITEYPAFYAIEGGAVAGANYAKGGAKVAAPNTTTDNNWFPVLFNTNGKVVSNKQYAMTSGDALNGNAARPDGFDAIEYDVNGKGKAPSCTQCHGSARDVEASFSTFKDATVAATITAAMNFPHISQNKALLVEEGDDFCTNCHGLDNLP